MTSPGPLVQQSVSPDPDVVGRREYVIRKRGLFYRPNSQGYTSEIIHAGRYTKAEAEKIVGGRPASEVTMSLASNWMQVDDKNTIAALRDEVERMTGDVSHIGECNKAVRSELAAAQSRVSVLETALKRFIQAYSETEAASGGLDKAFHDALVVLTPSLPVKDAGNTSSDDHPLLQMGEDYRSQEKICGRNPFALHLGAGAGAGGVDRLGS